MARRWPSSELRSVSASPRGVVHSRHEHPRLPPPPRTTSICGGEAGSPHRPSPLRPPCSSSATPYRDVQPAGGVERLPVVLVEQVEQRVVDDVDEAVAASTGTSAMW